MVSWPELRDAEATRADVERQRQENQRERNRLQAAIRDAEGRDRDNAARALLEGRDAPKPEADALRAELDAAISRAAVLDRAAQLAAARVTETMQEHGERWRGDILDRLPEAQREVEQTARAFLAACERVNAAADMYGRLGDPTAPARTRAPLAHVRSAENGGRVSVSAVVNECARMAATLEPSKPKAPVEVVQDQAG